MTATPPEARAEYSRARAQPRPLSGIGGAVGAMVLGGGLLGALMLVAAELSPLYEVHAATSSTALTSEGTGAHHAYALIPIAVLAGALTFAAARGRSRPVMLAIGVLGVLTLAIALVGDLPDARASGLIGTSAGRYTDASTSPQAGLYLETLAAALLVVSSGLGLLLGGPAPRRAD